MTGDRLRKLADAATPGPWRTGHGGFGGADVHSEPDAMLVAKAWPGVGVLETDNAALIAVLGPDAARLLADAMDGTEALLEWAERFRGGDTSLDPEEWYVVRDFARRVLKAFSALGEPS